VTGEEDEDRKTGLGCQDGEEEGRGKVPVTQQVHREHSTFAARLISHNKIIFF